MSEPGTTKALICALAIVSLSGCDGRSFICGQTAMERLATIEKCANTPRCNLTTEDLRELDYLRSDKVVYIRCGGDR